MNEFDQKAGDWDKNRMHLDRTIAIGNQLDRIIPKRPGLKVLEFGAGTGLLSFYLKHRFAEITLMDNSEEMLKMAEQKIEVGDISKFRILVFNLENDNYTGGTFDIIYSQMVLHHIGDTDAIFRKFHALLNPGGLLAIADLYSEDGSFHDFIPDVHNGFDPGKLSDMLKDLGFHDIKVSQCFVLKKEISAGNMREYPVFLLTAMK